MSAKIQFPLLLLMALLTGCIGTSGDMPTPVVSRAPSSVTAPATTPSQPDAKSTPTLHPPHPSPTPIWGAKPAVAQAVANLSARIGVDANAIEIVRVSADEFPAQNLGCPSPDDKGVEPVQPAFVTGQEIILAANDRQYVYHAHGAVVVFCGKR